MGLFTREENQSKEKDEIIESARLQHNFQKRTNYIERSSKEVSTEIKRRNTKLEDTTQTFHNRISEIQDELEKLKNRLNNLHHGVNSSIERIKLFATNQEFGELNEKLKSIKFDELISEKEFQILVEQNLK